MIPEKMQELILMTLLEQNYLISSNLDIDKWNDKYMSLLEEFLEPYVSSNASKEE